jgi:hypothetical protein
LSISWIARIGTTGSNRKDDAVKLEAQLPLLLRYFMHARTITEGANAIGSAKGYQIAFLPFGSQLIQQGCHDLIPAQFEILR